MYRLTTPGTVRHQTKRIRQKALPHYRQNQRQHHCHHRYKAQQQFFLAEGWQGYANPSKGNSIQLLSQGANDGKNFVRLICKGEITSFTTDKPTAVAPGDTINIESMIRGKGKAHIRIYCFDKNTTNYDLFIKLKLSDSENAKQIKGTGVGDVTKEPESKLYVRNPRFWYNNLLAAVSVNNARLDGFNPNVFEYTYTLNKDSAPLNEGEVVGNIEIYNSKGMVFIGELIVGEEIKLMDWFHYFWMLFKDMFA